MNQRVIPLRDLEEERALFGALDRNLHLLRRIYKVEAMTRGGAVRISGAPDAVSDAARALDRALERIRSGKVLHESDVEALFRRADAHGQSNAHAHGEHGHGSTQSAPSSNDGAGKLVEPRSENQARYLESIRTNTVTFGIGPAGTGKSYLAVASAVQFLRSGQFRRIVLCRPAVEAGESLGFLPGDLAAKINPYLRPLYDALNDVLPRGQLKRYMEEEIVEILPLAYMRGRTLDGSLIILDEAQNCTNTQMKMALTRLGARSKMIVTGDITQIDLPGNKASGLITARRILENIEGVGFVHMSRGDIVRHPVVSEIVHAYAREDELHAQHAAQQHGEQGHPSSHHGPADAHGHQGGHHGNERRPAGGEGTEDRPRRDAQRDDGNIRPRGRPH